MAETLTDVIGRHALRTPSRIALIWLENGEREARSVTYAQLDLNVRVRAAGLCRAGLQQQNVLLQLNNGIDFLESFLACLYAGVIPVPIAPPRPNRAPGALVGIAQHAGATALVGGERELSILRPMLGESLPSLMCLNVTEVDDSHEALCEASPAEIAFLQYTSGSTGAPRGVIITHSNLLSNEHAIQKTMALSDQTVFVSWLPLYHDMGLIGGALQPLFLGVPCVLMSPLAFLQRPVRWLAAIGRYGATTSGAPNFAYDQCVEKVTPEQRAGLKLSSWSVAFNGSEPVRRATLERFAAAFADCGFHRNSFFPCYGMAECTLLAAGVAPGVEPTFKHEGVSCGSAVENTQVRIVDPGLRRPLPEGEIGEIWISGPAVSQGYYRNDPASAQVFGARLESEPATNFLRTGDLGSIVDGSLFIEGRIKDVLVIRGRKVHPHDLEDTASQCNALLVRGGSVALQLEREDGEWLIIVQEVTREGWRNANTHQLRGDIVQAISDEHGIQVREVLLVKPGRLPRTSSGKLRRSLCREMLQAGLFENATCRSGG